MGYYTNSKRLSHDTLAGHSRAGKARCVDWPDGAPCPTDVPHAGAVVRHAVCQAHPATVLNGIPFQQNKGSGVVWCITVQYRAQQHTNTCNAEVSNITPWVTDDEPCYTEQQIREASCSIGAYHLDRLLVKLHG